MMKNKLKYITILLSLVLLGLCVGYAVAGYVQFDGEGVEYAALVGKRFSTESGSMGIEIFDDVVTVDERGKEKLTLSIDYQDGSVVALGEGERYLIVIDASTIFDVKSNSYLREEKQYAKSH